jgi:very-short-patch-repair endonuclease
MKRNKKFRYKAIKPVDLIERAELAKKRVEALRVNATPYELMIKDLLDYLGYNYIFQEPFFDNYFFLIADFYLPRLKLIIEVDGSQHYTKDYIKKENKRKKWLAIQGISVLRIKNKAVFNLNAPKLQEKILKCYLKRKPL